MCQCSSKSHALYVQFDPDPIWLYTCLDPYGFESVILSINNMIQIFSGLITNVFNNCYEACGYVQFDLVLQFEYRWLQITYISQFRSRSVWSLFIIVCSDNSNSLLSLKLRSACVKIQYILDPTRENLRWIDNMTWRSTYMYIRGNSCRLRLLNLKYSAMGIWTLLKTIFEKHFVKGDIAHNEG